MYSFRCVFLITVCFVAARAIAAEDEAVEWSLQKAGYKWQDTALIGFVRRTLDFVYLLPQCAFHCKRDYYCKSLNFNSDLHLCQLNFADHEGNPDALREVPGYLYFSSRNFQIDQKALGECSDVGCKERGLCVEGCYGGAGDHKCVCFDDKSRDTECNKRLPPSWSEWRDWEECSVTCGTGYQTRERDCLDPSAAANSWERVLRGGKCTGSNREFRLCGSGTSTCPFWDEWSAWTPCTSALSCGQGMKSRRRTCVNGEDCVGETHEESRCHMPGCEAPVLLQDGSFGEGRLEIYDDDSKMWGTVCTDGFDMMDAVVACRQAGLAGVYQVIYDESFGPGEGPPLLSQLECTNNESSLQECLHGPWKTAPCEKVVGLRCTVDGLWSGWTEWTECSVSCGNGTQLRTRACNYPPPLRGGLPCEGHTKERRTCSLTGCSRWTEWSKWTDCDVTCGNGTQIRDRTCYDEDGKAASDCEGAGTMFQVCVTAQCAVDGVWKTWERWSKCDLPCGGGKRTRSRHCYGPFDGGKECDGSPSESEDCNSEPCPVNGVWKEWSDWHDCDVGCGGGTQIRNRTCHMPKFGGKKCVGKDVESIPCNMNPCSEDGKWHEWSDWSECSEECGGGIKSRTRECEDPKFGGSMCQGQSTEEDACNEQPCPVDGEWLQWSKWEECTASCGPGVQTRDRQCSLPEFGGRACVGDAYDTRECVGLSCPTDGYWEDWSEWTECTVTCGGGVSLRQRMCVSPKHGGAPCEGEATENTTCHDYNCEVDGKWLEWSSWEECSVSCGEGKRERRRECTTPENGGNPCEGKAVEEEHCQQSACPVDGVWEDWTDWTECSLTCGGGMESRERICFGPFDGGQECSGDASETRECNTQGCPAAGEWMGWSEWSACSVTCLGGVQQRERTCNMTTHGKLTLPCQGNATETRACNTNGCIIMSCAQLRQDAVDVVSGWYTIDPSGKQQGLSPFNAFCDFDSEAGQGLTIVGHNFQFRTHVTDYEGAGEWQAFIKYNNTKYGEADFENEESTKQVHDLVSISQQCEQYIKWECYSATITNPASGSKVTYWTNWRKEERYYWGGADPNSENCACGMTDSCAVPGTACNCDANDEQWRYDDGFITEKEDLPIKSFDAGDTGDVGNEQGYHTIGPLICKGVQEGAFAAGDYEYDGYDDY